MAYGTINADVIQSSVTGVSLGAGNATRFKNRIINGNMVISQYNGTSATTPATFGSKTYPIDRFWTNNSQASKLTFQQNAGSVTPPNGFINYLGISVAATATVSSGDYFQFAQSIEGLNVADLGWGTANAKTVTLSFWVYSNVTGTFGGAITNSAQTRSYPFSYTISAANTWTQATITIAGDTSGTWLTTNGTGIDVRFSVGMGSSFSGTAGTWAAALYASSTGSTSLMGSTSNYLYITGVQLEVGSSATGFDFRDYTTELAMCQRYFQKYASPHIVGVCATSSAASRVGGLFPVVMRADPTATYAGSLNVFDGAGVGTISSINVSYCTTQVMELDFVTGATIAPYRPAILYVQTGGSLSFSAEL
jgi:hypothetical protein